MFIDCPHCETTWQHTGPTTAHVRCPQCAREFGVRPPSAQPQQECSACEPIRQGRATTFQFGQPSLERALIPCARCGKPFRGFRPPLARPVDWAEPPYRPGERIDFMGPPIQVRLNITHCDACQTRLAVPRDFQEGQPGLTCGACGHVFAPRYAGEGETVSWRVVRNLFPLGQNVALPMRAPVSRAWIERDNPARGRALVVPLDGECWLDLAGEPLTSADPWTFHLFPSAQGWRVRRQGQSGERGLQSSDVLGAARFGQGRALEVDTPPDALCASPENEQAWEVWTDQLLERGEPLGRLLRGTPAVPETRMDQLGLLEPFVRRQFAQVQWNRFGFVHALQLEASVFSQHPFVVEPRRAPAVSVLATLTLTVDERSAADAMSGLIRARVPRSLRRVQLRGPRVALGGTESVLEQLRADAPWLETTPHSLWA